MENVNLAIATYEEHGNTVRLEEERAKLASYKAAIELMTNAVHS